MASKEMTCQTARCLDHGAIELGVDIFLYCVQPLTMNIEFRAGRSFDGNKIFGVFPQLDGANTEQE